MTIEENIDKVKFNCSYCGASLKVRRSILNKNINCPKCTNFIVPHECVAIQNPKPIEIITNIKKTIKYKFVSSIALLTFLFFAFISYALFFYEQSAKIDNSLLEPRIKYKQSNKNIKKLSQTNLNGILSSIKNPEKELPAGSILPEFTAEQERPSRTLIKSAVVKAEKILSREKTVRNDDLIETIKILDLAFTQTYNPLYLDLIINHEYEKSELSIDEILEILKMIANQKKAIPYVDSQAYIALMAKMFNTIDEKSQIVNDPVNTIKLYRCLYLLPKMLQKLKIESKLTTILAEAFKNKNLLRSDGIFLEPDESTAFSLQLIDTVWQYRLDQKEIPQWLFQLAEKESCRLAFRLEPDGSLPDWTGKNIRYCLTSEIYKAAIVFDREDLRFIAYGGRRMEGAYPPVRLNYCFPEIGEAILRTNWNIYHLNNIYQNIYLGVEGDCFQLTYNSILGRVSLYAGTASFGVFSLKNGAFELKKDLFKLTKNHIILANCDLSILTEDKMISFVFKNYNEEFDLKLGKMYIMSDDNIIKTCIRFYPVCDWVAYKPILPCEIKKINSEVNFIFPQSSYEKVVFNNFFGGSF